jgi:hypothetical protein
MIHRHPFRGLFGGLLLGIGLSLVLVQLGAAPLGTTTVVVIVAVCAILGVTVAYALPPRRGP